jgi:hypothetical protein
VFDLLAAFTEAELETPTYALRNSHWNERGNAVAAQELADALEPRLRERARSEAPPGQSPR